MASAILFPLGVRLSTWLALALFLALAAQRRQRAPLLAAAAWLFGFELVFQITSLAAGRPLPGFHWGPFALIAVGVASLVAAARAGITPSPVWLLAAGCCFAAWVVTGFHVNEHTTANLDVTGEVLNEAAKMLWAAAYFVPLIWVTRSHTAQPTETLPALANVTEDLPSSNA